MAQLFSWLTRKIFMTDSAYQQQLIEKQDYLQSLFQGITLPAWEVFPSPEQHYRMRAEFRIWHEGDTLSYAMFERGLMYDWCLSGGEYSLVQYAREMMPLFLDGFRKK